MTTISIPDDKLIEEKFNEYVAALGKVAYSWNYLQETLGQMFATVMRPALTPTILAVWFSEPNDRAQRRMLKAAIEAGALFGWPHKIPDCAKADILWLLKEANELSARRDEAVHAPVHIETTEKGSAISGSFFPRKPASLKASRQRTDLRTGSIRVASRAADQVCRLNHPCAFIANVRMAR